MCVVGVEWMMERLQLQPLLPNMENQKRHLKHMEQKLGLGKNYLQLDKVLLHQMGKVQLHQQQDKERHQQFHL